MATYIKLFICLLIFLFSFFPQTVYSYEKTESNNKFGIHLAQPQAEDIIKAAELVNSNGGKWGYITLVIQEDDRDKGKWQGVFDQLRELKLIPIIRLATKPDGSNWKKPTPEDADEWVKFLNSLHWVVKNRYIILFNEINHATEWGGTVDPISFANTSKVFAAKLKVSNKDYVVMLGGFDASAPEQRPRYADEANYLTEVIETITPTDFNKLFDGWSSHSYPNPGFVGSPWSAGRGTVRTYQWELNLLSTLGVKNLPVFITETGWHGGALGREQVAQNYKIAYENIWLPDNQVVAVTPFVLNYQSDPFLQFSWIKPGGQEVYPEFETVKGLSKSTGEPVIIDKGKVSYDLPKELVAESSYHFYFNIINIGQAIWNSEEGYKFNLVGLDPNSYLLSSINPVRPFQDREQDFFIRTGAETGKRKVAIALFRNDKGIVGSTEWKFTIVPLPNLNFMTGTFPKLHTQGDDFELQIFDQKEELVYKEKDIKVAEGKGKIRNVKNIALDKPYRVVLVKKYYLPVQTHVSFTKGENEVKFKNMYPLDFNVDGAFKLDDIVALLKDLRQISLVLP